MMSTDLTAVLAVSYPEAFMHTVYTTTEGCFNYQLLK